MTSSNIFTLRPFKTNNIEFDGDKYIIHNLSKIDETILNFDFPIEVRNILEQNEVSCRNNRVLIGFLNDFFSGDEEKIQNFFKKNYPAYSYDYCNNSHNWMYL